MKKALRIILLVLAVLLVLAAGIGLYNYGPMLAMRPTETGLVSDRYDDLPIIALRNNRNALYFVDTGDGYLLIDAGSNTEKVKASMADLEIDPADVKWVLLTHSDYDHVAALPLFPNADIYMGENEIGLLDGTVNRNGSSGNHLPDGIELDAIHLLGDDEVELLFGDVHVYPLKSPGHTPGSVAYFLVRSIDETYLFTGDAFKYSKGKLSAHPFTMDKAIAAETITTIETFAARGLTVLTSHYGFFTTECSVDVSF